MEFFNKYAMGFICVGSKTRTLGGKTHTICCGLTSILFRAHIVEGKDRPWQCGPKEFENLGKTASLVLRMRKHIFGSVNSVFIDGGFCIAQLIFFWGQIRVYSGALLKKQLYCPKNFPRDEIDKHFEKK